MEQVTRCALCGSLHTFRTSAVPEAVVRHQRIVQFLNRKAFAYSVPKVALLDDGVGELLIEQFRCGRRYQRSRRQLRRRLPDIFVLHYHQRALVVRQRGRREYGRGG